MVSSSFGSGGRQSQNQNNIVKQNQFFDLESKKASHKNLDDYNDNNNTNNKKNDNSNSNDKNKTGEKDGSVTTKGIRNSSKHEIE